MNKCIVCGSELVEPPLMTCENFPASAQNIPSAETVKDNMGISLNLCQCKWCGLIQFDCEPVDYYKDVIRAGGFSTTMVELRRDQYSYLINKYNLRGKKVVEVGTGRGEFLSVLTEFDVAAYGIENCEPLIEIAVSNGLNVKKGFVLDENYVIPNAPFDAFLSFNFLEHQPDPSGMLKGIYNNLKEDGVGLITVPSFEYIIENNGFYELIRDHIAYYTEDTFKFLLEKNGFKVLECRMINRDTLSAIVEKRKKVNIASLKDNFVTLKEELNNYIDSFAKVGKKVAVWGASHQGFTLIPAADISNKIEYIIDSAPFKQGKFAPASHVPIVSPEHYFRSPVEAIIIIAPGYTNEITKVIRERYHKDVKIAVLKSQSLEIF